jgi:hypothetical protein
MRFLSSGASASLTPEGMLFHGFQDVVRPQKILDCRNFCVQFRYLVGVCLLSGSSGDEHKQLVLLISEIMLQVRVHRAHPVVMRCAASRWVRALRASALAAFGPGKPHRLFHPVAPAKLRLTLRLVPDRLILEKVREFFAGNRPALDQVYNQPRLL